MILVADSKKRVTLPTRPGASFELQAHGEDKFILTRLEPVVPGRARVTVSKRGNFTVAKTAHKVSATALKEALAEFP
jgi:hypothetical protein